MEERVAAAGGARVARQPATQTVAARFLSPGPQGGRGRPYSVKSVGRYKRQSMTYDVECLKLAKHFLHNKPNNDTEKNRQELAQRIQDAVEDFLSELQQK
jgi:hypothetical protein